MGVRCRHYCRSRALFLGLVSSGLMACASTSIQYDATTGSVSYTSNKEQHWTVKRCEQWDEAAETCKGMTIVEVGATNPELEAVTAAIERIPKVE